jgi:hypothetical protein
MFAPTGRRRRPVGALLASRRHRRPVLVTIPSMMRPVTMGSGVELSYPPTIRQFDRNPARRHNP